MMLSSYIVMPKLFQAPSSPPSSEHERDSSAEEFWELHRDTDLSQFSGTGSGANNDDYGAHPK
eukprot:650824-Karenia_brevis.AAC.1